MLSPLHFAFISLLLIGLQELSSSVRGIDSDSLESRPSTAVLDDPFLLSTRFEDYDLDSYCVVEPGNTKDGEITNIERTWAKRFMTDYTAIYANYSKSANTFSEKIKNAVKDLKFWIDPIVESRLKTPESLKEKLDERLQTHNFTSYEEILDRMYDIIGIRCIVFFESIEIEQIISHLKTTPGINILQIKNTSNIAEGKGNRCYRGLNLRVRFTSISEHEKFGNDRQDAEIQLRGLYDHGFYQIFHKFGYKPQTVLSGRKQKYLQALQYHTYKANDALQRLLDDDDTGEYNKLKYQVAPKRKSKYDRDEEWTFEPLIKPLTKSRLGVEESVISAWKNYNNNGNNGNVDTEEL